jgi:hypothetical protein
VKDILSGFRFCWSGISVFGFLEDSESITGSDWSNGSHIPGSGILSGFRFWVDYRLFALLDWLISHPVGFIFSPRHFSPGSDQYFSS